jgi:hypothetical protein
MELGFGVEYLKSSKLQHSATPTLVTYFLFILEKLYKQVLQSVAEEKTFLAPAKGYGLYRIMEMWMW